MLKRMWYSLRRDNRINLRNGYYLVTVAVALIYLAMVLWVIPDNTTLAPTVFLLDQTEGARFAALAQEMGQADQVVLVESQEEIKSSMAEFENSVGVVLGELAGADGLPEAKLFFQPYQNEKVRNLLAVSVEAELRQLYGQGWSQPTPVERQWLRGEAAEEPPPLNRQFVPVLLFSDAAMIGLIFIAGLIFLEKEEGTLKAYLVTPGRVWEYLLSKAFALGFLAVIFTLLLAPLSLGGGPNYPSLLSLMFASSVFASLLGAWIAVYFDNLNQFFFPAVGVMILMGLPAVAYFVPSFSPWWLRWLPTYPLIFGLREAVFPSGNPQIVLTALIILGVLALIFLLLASRAFIRQLVYR